MYARPIRNEELPQFDALAVAHGSIFHQPEWSRIFGDQLLRMGIFDKKDAMIGGFYAYRRRYLGISLYRNPPFTPDAGPFWIHRSQHPVSTIEEEREVVEAMAEGQMALRGALQWLSLSQGVKDTLPFRWKGYRVIPSYTYLLNLEKDAAALRAGLSSSFRNHVSKAQKDGLECRQIHDYNVIKSLVLKTFQRKNKDPKAAFLSNILRDYATDANSYSYVTFREGQPIAGVFIMIGKGRAVNLLAGYDSARKHSGAGVVALFNAILHAKEIGLKLFDFEGSTIPEVEKYFRNFGAVLTPYFTVNRGWLPLECVLKFAHRHLF